MMRILLVYYVVHIYLFDAHIKNTLCEHYIILCAHNMYLLCTLHLFGKTISCAPCVIWCSLYIYLVRLFRVLLVLFGAHFIFIWEADFIFWCAHSSCDFIMKLMKDP